MFYRTLLASEVTRVSDEDLSSQLNHIWSTLLLVGLGAMISMVQYVGDPIQCLCPASMPEVHCNYTKALCWVKESYYTDDDDKASLVEVTKSESRIAYYPWAPWILFLMAAALKVPHMVWHSFAPQSDLNLSKLVTLADVDGDVDNIATIIRVWLIRTKRRYTDIFHKVKRVLSLMGLFWLGRHKRTFLTGLIMCVKTMYLVVSVSLFFSLNLFLDEDFTNYGFEVIQDFLHGLPQITPKFPKQIICSIQIRQMNNVNRFSIQCILPINMYNQKIFLFLWFWFIFLILVNGCSLLKWGHKLLSPYQRWKFVNNYVEILSHLDWKAKQKQRRKKRRRKDRDHNGNAIQIDTGPVQSDGASAITLMEEQGLGSNPDRNEDNNNNGELRARGAIRSNSTDNAVVKLKKKKKRKGVTFLSSIEIDQDEFTDAIVNRNTKIATSWMLKNLGHDGVLVFRKLESAVGIVLANEIFHELHNQVMAAVHHSET